MQASASFRESKGYKKVKESLSKEEIIKYREIFFFCRNLYSEANLPKKYHYIEKHYMFISEHNPIGDKAIDLLQFFLPPSPPPQNKLAM